MGRVETEMVPWLVFLAILRKYAQEQVHFADQNEIYQEETYHIQNECTSTLESQYPMDVEFVAMSFEATKYQD